MEDNEESKLEKFIKPKGLQNLGLSCYMNSLLQCLYFIPELREYFIKNKETFNNDKPICKALAEVMYGLKYEKNEYFIPKNFREEIRKINPLFLEDKACDVKDLFINLIDVLLEELKNNNNSSSSEEENENNEYSLNSKYQFLKAKNDLDKNIINELLGGFYLTTMKCNKTQSNFYSIQIDTSLSFDLKNIHKNKKELTFNSCFDYFFQEKNSSYYCENCKIVHEFKTNDSIYELPKILVLILDRGKEKAFKVKFEFNSEILDLKYYMHEKNYKKEDTYYQLFGLSTHAGLSSAEGHYTACCLADNGNYYYFSDTFVKEINLDRLYENEPYLLFYRKTDISDMHSKNINNKIQNQLNQNDSKNKSKDDYLRECLEHFLSNKKENYSIDYYFQDIKNPLIWKLIINSPDNDNYKNDKYIFKFDFNRDYEEYLTNITSLETPINHLNFENTSLLFKYKYNKERNLLENIFLYVNFLYKLILKPDRKLFDKYYYEKIEKYCGKNDRL